MGAQLFHPCRSQRGARDTNNFVGQISSDKVSGLGAGEREVS